MGHGCHDCGVPNGCICSEERKVQLHAQKIEPKKFHYYCVTGTMPKGPKTPYRQTKHWGVVASTPELAGMQVRLSNEGVEIASIQHRGLVDVFHEVLEFVK